MASAKPAPQELKEVSLVKPTGLEKLMQRIAEEKAKTAGIAEQRANEQKIIKLKCDLIKSIFSVYGFIKIELGLPHGELSLEEFEAAEEKLKEVAKVRSGWIQSIQNPFKSKMWAYYLADGYFPQSSQLNKKFIYCSSLRPKGEISFASAEIIEHLATSKHQSTDETPTNVVQLFQELCKKRNLFKEAKND